MIYSRLEHFLRRRRCTLLGVGPMSVNCVDATIELANHYEIPLMLIASRRQIDSQAMGGGYVNNWTTEEFARYVMDHDKKGKIILSRDHGGPWQNSKEAASGMGLRQAMESAKASYLVDIESGFELIHIDPSVDIHSTPDFDEVMDRVYDLYEFCWREAQARHREIIFEIGTEEQNGSTNSQEELNATLFAMEAFCDRYHFPRPSFIVIQSGTRVIETRNVGSLDSPIRVSGELPVEIQVPKVIEICNAHGIFMKAHNTDYLSDESLRWHPRLGIHAANVAPEFGVAETRALIEILEANSLGALADAFLEISLKSHKWDKWMAPDTKATDRDRAIIAGHYVFATPEFTELKSKAARDLKSCGIVLDDFLRQRVKDSIMRYLLNFRLVRAA